MGEPTPQIAVAKTDPSPEKEDILQGLAASVEELAILESQTLAAEVNLIGMLRERMSPAARHGGTIQIAYRRLHYKTEQEVEELGYLTEGSPTTEGGKPLSGLLVIDKYSTADLSSATEESSPRIGQYTGQRLYLSSDKRWVLAERVGEYSEAVASISQWSARCKFLTDRNLLDSYSVASVSDGLFAAANQVRERLSSQLDSLKKRSEKVSEVSSVLAKLRSLSPDRSKSASLGEDARKPAANIITRR